MAARFLALRPGGARRISIVALQWTVGLVLLLQALTLAFSTRARADFAGTGLAPAIRPLLAWAEVAAALLFLYPRTTMFGAIGLLGVLLATTGVHLYRGQGFTGLLVYMAAIVVAATHRGEPSWHITPGKKTS
jgi:hypothetical protein